MKLMIMPKEPSWWIWAIMVGLLAVGLAGQPLGFVGAITLSIAQTVYFFAHERSPRPFPVQIRIGYTLLLIACYLPALRWLYWLPAIGTSAMIFFGYCLMARVLSLFPWNRTEPVTMDLLRRTFLSPPVVGNVRQGMPVCGCPGGVCSLEARVAQFNKS